MQKPGLFRMNGFMVFLLTCISLTTRAQQPGYLILLETENKQPFTVRLGDQFFVSSSSGNLTLSDLKDSSYRVEVLFPQKSTGQWIFPVPVHGRDQGFLLKGGDSAWVLYNWQTFETIVPVKELDSSRILDKGVKRQDGFSRLMAGVVNDSSVMYNTYTGAGFVKDSGLVKKEIQKPEIQNGIATDSSALANRLPAGRDSLHAVSSTQTASGTPAVTPVVPASGMTDKKAKRDSLQALKNRQDSLQLMTKIAKKDSLIAQRRTRDSLMAFRKVFVHDSLAAAKKLNDSLAASQKLAIQKPAPKESSKAADVALPVVQGPGTSSPVSPPVTRPVLPAVTPGIKKLREVSLKISRKLVFIDIGKDGLTDTITLFVFFETPVPATGINGSGSSVSAGNKPLRADSTGQKNPEGTDKLALKASESGCGQLASDADMEFLRSAILKANTEDEKISQANGAFEQKCFSTAQIRLLAGLFVSDKARYRLMQAARPHIADPQHFAELANMYTDRNFQRKFLVLAGKLQ
jgi:hypothetical protein